MVDLDDALLVDGPPANVDMVGYLRTVGPFSSLSLLLVRCICWSKYR